MDKWKYCILCEEWVQNDKHGSFALGYHDGILVQSAPPEMTEEIWQAVFDNEPSPEEIEEINKEAQYGI